ncbi:hypothetical protein MG293_003892 [Ovis ammon polii]|uniref:Uncharacterized protein n=1 Tax=Ovis ammon polii TaxID=230172 RepID=A0AAD4UIU0_OVIAM|nr:hypothetical protein MG293_003892 [Ovis ammon polii]
MESCKRESQGRTSLAESITKKRTENVNWIQQKKDHEGLEGEQFCGKVEREVGKFEVLLVLGMCCVHLSIASVKERFLSALITMVTPPRAKNIWLLLLSNQARFPVIRAFAAKWLMAALHRNPGVGSDL